MITEAVTTDSPLTSTALKVKVVLQSSLEFPKSLSPSLYEMVIVLMSVCAELKVVAFNEAFQMFESQNGRGKELEAYNLLKAYHIRAMSSSLWPFC